MNGLTNSKYQSSFLENNSCSDLNTAAAQENYIDTYEGNNEYYRKPRDSPQHLEVGDHHNNRL